MPKNTPPDVCRLRNRHRIFRKKRFFLELNFVIPNVDLETGKRFAPYFDLADRPRFQAWERLVNSEFGFADPSDPVRKRAFQIPSDLPGDKLQQQR